MAIGTFSRRTVVAGMAALPLMPTRLLAATSLRDRVMVQGRPQDTGSPYKLRNIMPALDRLGGVRKMRCREPYSGTPGWNTYVALAREGVKFCFTLSVRDINRTISDLKAFLAVAPRSIWAIECPNEPDLNPAKYKGMVDVRLGYRTGDAPALMAYIKDASAALKADPTLATIPLIASNDFMQAEQGPFTQFGNIHIYPRGSRTNVPARLDGFGKLIAAGGHQQGVITEWGRTTGGGAKNVTSPPVSLEEQGALLASDVSAALDRPFVHTINLYEMLSWGGTSEMNNFGLFNFDMTPRPAVAAIREVIRG